MTELSEAPPIAPMSALPWYERASHRFRFLRLLPKNDFGDWLFALILFRHWHGRWPKRSGGTINDALFRLKTSVEITHPLRVYVSDKEHLKDFVRTKLGDQFNVPTLAYLRSWESVKQYDFPPRCVIKPTHLSGAIILRKAGEAIDRRIVERWFKMNLYDHSRERNYRSLVPKIVVEPFVFELETPLDYKIYCSNGEPRLITKRVGTLKEGSRSFYDTKWNLQPIRLKDATYVDQPRPANLDAMLHVARVLSREFTFIRVDLYSDESEVKVSELTNCPFNAGMVFDSPESELLASRLLFGA
jgi:hypothetical protein